MMAIILTLQCIFSINEVLLDGNSTTIKVGKLQLIHYHRLIFRPHSSFPVVPIMSCKAKESSSKHTLYLVKSFQFLSALHCQDLDSFEDYKPVILVECPSIWICLPFPHSWIQAVCLWQENYRNGAVFSLNDIRWHFLFIPLLMMVT